MMCFSASSFLLTSAVVYWQCRFPVVIMLLLAAAIRVTQSPHGLSIPAMWFARCVFQFPSTSYYW